MSRFWAWWNKKGSEAQRSECQVAGEEEMAVQTTGHASITLFAQMGQVRRIGPEASQLRIEAGPG
jgi:hypothetical protein